MKIFKKHKHSGYGVTWEDYSFQHYIPERIDYNLRISVLRLWHLVFGHRWGRWSKFSYVAEGKTGFATVGDKQTRTCSCYQKQERAWSKKTQLLLEDMQKRWGKSFSTGLVGELSGVRFIKTKTL